MSASEFKTEEKIVMAAIDCVEEYGFHGTTIRRIAKRADVNSAAISYYFRSKEKLLDRAIQEALKNAFDWEDFRSSESFPIQERITAIFEDLMTGALRYPGLSRALFFEAREGSGYRELAMNRMKVFMEELAVDLKMRGLRMDDSTLRMAIAQMASASFIAAVVWPQSFMDFIGEDVAEQEMRGRYLRRLVKGLFTPEPDSNAG